MNGEGKAHPFRTSGRILCQGDSFISEHGSQVLLRGVNFSGASKYPVEPDGRSHLPQTYDKTQAVSFVGRPVPLEEAQSHFRRLRQWGFNFLRWLVTWEALEHQGPGEYDEAYLDYTQEMIRLAGENGLYVWIDPHQDVWSRFTGGDGAPAWTLEAAGIDIGKIGPTATAMLHSHLPRFYPEMSWPLNYTRVTVATMFTLFFGGNRYAPHLKVDGQPIQDWLQEHYFAALAQLAQRLREFDHVVGYGSMNEPFSGYISRTNLDKWEVPLKLGPVTTPVESMALASGHSMEAPYYEKSALSFRYFRHIQLNPLGQRLWRPGYDCPWRSQGVWDFDKKGRPVILKPEFFTRLFESRKDDREKKEVIFFQDFLRPFVNNFAQKIRAIDANAAVFLEGEPQPEKHDELMWGKEDAKKVINSSHFYDGKLLFTKSYHPWFSLGTTEHNRIKPLIGRRNIKKFYRDYFAKLKRLSQNSMKGVPTIIGEFGIPFDMNDKQGLYSGDYGAHAEALANYYDALDARLLSGTLWNYTPSNTHAHGDGWNREDLSIFCKDDYVRDRAQGNKAEALWGGRGLQGVVRPYALRIPGKLWQNTFKGRNGNSPASFFLQFECHWHKEAERQPGLVYVPLLHFGSDYKVEMNHGYWHIEEDGEIAHWLLLYPEQGKGMCRLWLTGP